MSLASESTSGCLPWPALAHVARSRRRWPRRSLTSRGPAAGASWAIVGSSAASSCLGVSGAQGELATLGLDEACLLAFELDLSEQGGIKSRLGGLPGGTG